MTRRPRVHRCAEGDRADAVALRDEVALDLHARRTLRGSRRSSTAALRRPACSLRQVAAAIQLGVAPSSPRGTALEQGQRRPFEERNRGGTPRRTASVDLIFKSWRSSVPAAGPFAAEAMELQLALAGEDQ
jgi:hypothetical protein